MTTKYNIPWRRILNDLKYYLIFVILYMTMFAYLDYEYELRFLHVPLAMITVPGTVVGLLLGFRTNSAYDRWWEARIIWGAIVNDSRSWVRQLRTFIPYDSLDSEEFRVIKKMSYRQIAWNFVLASHLRKLPFPTEIKKYLTKEDYEILEGKLNKPNTLLTLHSMDLKNLRKAGLIDEYQFVQLERMVIRFTDSMGRCERIKSTVFPTGYSLLVDILIYIWILFLPFALVDTIGLILIPATVALAFSFLIADRIAIYMQDPFENRPSDTPMLTISRTIEINILQELGVESHPDLLQPVDGVLM